MLPAVFFAASNGMGIFELDPWSRDQGEVLAETCQLVLFDPTLLSCAKKRRVEPPGRSCPKKTLGKGFLWTLSETKGPRPF